MDAERTMQFLLDQQARHEAMMQGIGEKMQEIGEKQAENQTLVNQLIILMSQLGKRNVENTKAIKELRAAQKQTEKSLNTFLKSMSSGNGGGRRS